jgi:hypothetical protein
MRCYRRAMTAPDTSPDSLSARLLQDRSKRPVLLDDCVRLIDDEVASKGGLSGLAIKGGYKVVTSLKPGMVRESMDSLLDDFVRRLDPFFAAHMGGGGAAADFSALLSAKKADVANALLGITDDRARRAQNPTLKSVYDKLRPQAHKHVEEAVPRVGRTLQRHL